MTRWFNIAGPCKDDIHYMLSPTVRLPDLEELIEQESRTYALTGSTKYEVWVSGILT
jgi:hypothetical protein